MGGGKAKRPRHNFTLEVINWSTVQNILVCRLAHKISFAIEPVGAGVINAKVDSNTTIAGRKIRYNSVIDVLNFVNLTVAIRPWVARYE